MSKKPLLVLAAGGSGGHMFPAQALAEEMLQRGWRVRLTTDVRGARYTQNFPKEVDVQILSSATFARGGFIAKCLVPFRIAFGMLAAIGRFIVDRPKVVVGFGGYPSIPALGAAWVLRIARIIHEQNGVLGRVNQLFAKRVTAVACGTWPTLMPDDIEGVHIGNPVRASVFARRAAPYIAPGDYPMEVLVLGGSQGARIMSDIVPPAISSLPLNVIQNIRVSHQARPEDIDRVSDYYAQYGIRADVSAFFDDVPRRMSEAQLVISRAGASTIADISVIGRPSILVPLAAAIRDEQTANTQGLAKAGAALVLQETEFEVGNLSQRLAIYFSDPQTASKMAAAALGQSVPDSAQRLCDLVEAVAQKHINTNQLSSNDTQKETL